MLGQAIKEGGVIMIDTKSAYKKILEEHLHDLHMNEVTFHLNPYGSGWLDSRYHVLELLGFKKSKVNTPKKVIAIIEKYNEEIESWRQK